MPKATDSRFVNPGRPSAIVLLGANALPLAGVLIFDWSVFDVVLLYWIENVAIGALNVLRMLTARPDPGIWPRRVEEQMRFAMGASLFLAAFFVVHYGFFCWGHLQFLVGFFGDGQSIETVLADPMIWVSVLAIAASHLYSYFHNFIGGGEFRRTSTARLMSRPYGRIVVLHVSIIAGGFLVMTLGSNIFLLVVLVVVKTVVDLRQHERERTMLGDPEQVVS